MDNRIGGGRKPFTVRVLDLFNLNVLFCRLLRCKMLLVMTVNFTKFLNFVKCNNLMKRCTFTLTEILITLGIIGVVAAKTLPVLIQSNS